MIKWADLEIFKQNTKWSLQSWKPSALEVKPHNETVHRNFLTNFHKSYPLLVRQNQVTTFPISNNINTITTNICNSTANQNIDNTTEEEIIEYNEDLTAYLKYIKNGSKLYDGIENITEDVVVAVAPPRKNGVPWFGRVVKLHSNLSQLDVRWLDRLETKNIYFYLTEKLATIHYDTIICNGVQLEPVIGNKLMWKLITPLSFIQNLNCDEPPNIIQQSGKIPSRVKQIKYDLSKMLFGNSEEFITFVKSMK